MQREKIDVTPVFGGSMRDLVQCKRITILTFMSSLST